MEVAAALSILISITQTLANLGIAANQVSALIQKAQAEGRTKFTDEEWQTITSGDDQARAFLQNAINDALAKQGTAVTMAGQLGS